MPHILLVCGEIYVYFSDSSFSYINIVCGTEV